MKELTLKLAGIVKSPNVGTKDFEAEAYKNYLIISDFLKGDRKENVRESWGLTKEDFRELLFELYFALVERHTNCGSFKRVLLMLIGLCKFGFGGLR